MAKFNTKQEIDRKVHQILTRARHYKVSTNAIEEYKQALSYAKENASDIDTDFVIENAKRKLANSDDITLIFDKRRRANKQRLDSIKVTMNNMQATNQDIIDYIQGIQNLVDNINILENISSEQVGEFYQMARNKNIKQDELISILNTAKSQSKTYDKFIELSRHLINKGGKINA